jgi:hypothetical protein
MFYKLLNFPKLPENLVDEVYKTVSDSINVDPKKHQNHVGYKEFKTRKLTTPDNKEIMSVSIDRYKMSKSLNHWLLTHVHPNPQRQHISLYNAASQSMGPHVDSDRDKVWMYVINPGGKKVETVWYHEHNQPVSRPDMQDISTNYMGGAICDYSKLIELERFELPSHVWVEINSSIIHSVEGLETNRLAIQITP